jgi:hypothetical protein
LTFWGIGVGVPLAVSEWGCVRGEIINQRR